MICATVIDSYTLIQVDNRERFYFLVRLFPQKFLILKKNWNYWRDLPFFVSNGRSPVRCGECRRSMSQQYPYYLNRQSMIIIISWGNVWQPFVINAELKLLMMNLLSVKNVAIVCRKTCQKKRVLLVKR